MSVLLNFTIFPTDKGDSVSQYVSKVIKMIDESGVEYKLTAMSTLIETETMKEALDIVNSAYLILEPLSSRIYATANFDIRQGKHDRMKQKTASIEKLIGKVKL